MFPAIPTISAQGKLASAALSKQQALSSALRQALRSGDLILGPEKSTERIQKPYKNHTKTMVCREFNMEGKDNSGLAAARDIKNQGVPSQRKEPKPAMPMQMAQSRSMRIFMV